MKREYGGKKAFTSWLKLDESHLSFVRLQSVPHQLDAIALTGHLPGCGVEKVITFDIKPERARGASNTVSLRLQGTLACDT